MAGPGAEAPPVLIVGCGDIGLRVARRYLARGIPVSGVVRSAESAALLGDLGIEPLLADLERPASLATLPLAGRAVFHFVPPPARGEHDPLTTHLIEHLEAGTPPARLIYLGTSGVYGDCAGAWVDEETPPDPQTARARRRLHAEQQLRAWGERSGVPVILLRVGGIYGAGRYPLPRLERGEPILREAECGYTNRIHAEDLADILVAAAERGRAGALYNVSDGQPGTMSGYFKAVAAHFGLPPPPEIDLEEARRTLSPAMLSYLLESRRMDNRRLLQELELTLRYPDLEAGLAAERPSPRKTPR